ncbi:UTRA domain-containing protein [Muribacter muris]|nr:UTRA domain-containing protein [Muribacter muris]
MIEISGTMHTTASGNKPLPVYLQIKNTILSRIHKGRWKAGSTIPTEMALSQEFGVSRMTVNRALKELTAERVLVRRQGSGTMVAQQQFNHTFIEVRNIAKDIKQAKRQYRAEVLALTSQLFNALPPAVKTAFLNSEKPNMPENTPIFSVEIVHYADNEPLQYEERWVDSRFVPAFLEQDFSVVNTSDYLIALVPLESGQYAISAVLATDNVAAALNLSRPSAVLRLSRSTCSQGQVVTYVNMWHAGERFQFSGQL